jgi:hypothetical protein
LQCDHHRFQSARRFESNKNQIRTFGLLFLLGIRSNNKHHTFDAKEKRIESIHRILSSTTASEKFSSEYSQFVGSAPFFKTLVNPQKMSLLKNLLNVNVYTALSVMFLLGYAVICATSPQQPNLPLVLALWIPFGILYRVTSIKQLRRSLLKAFVFFLIFDSSTRLTRRAFAGTFHAWMNSAQVQDESVSSSVKIIEAIYPQCPLSLELYKFEVGSFGNSSAASDIGIGTCTLSSEAIARNLEIFQSSIAASESTLADEYSSLPAPAHPLCGWKCKAAITVTTVVGAYKLYRYASQGDVKTLLAHVQESVSYQPPPFLLES